MLTNFQNGLLSIAVAAFNWASNSFNCGFLNYIFTINENSTITLRQTDILSAAINAITQNLFQGGSRNLEVYQWLPSELKDGSGTSHQVAILTGVLIFVSLLLIIVPITVIVVSCSCYCCPKNHTKNTKLNTSQENGTNQDAYFLEKIHAQTLEAIKHSDKNIERFNLCHIAAFAISFVLIAALLVSIAFLFVAGELVTGILNQNDSESQPTSFEPNNFNFLSGLQFIFLQFLDFLNTGINKGRTATDAFLVDVNSIFGDLLKMKVSQAVDELLVEYGVQPLVHTVENLQNGLNALQNNMEYIRLNNQQVSSNISRLVGEFKVIHDLAVPELENVCAVSMGAEITALCDSLKSNASKLLLQFNPSALKVDPPAVLNFVFKELGVDLSKILGQFSQITAKILEVKDQVLLNIASFLDLNSLFAPIVQIWDTLGTTTTTIKESTDKITETISESLPIIRTLIYALIYSPIAVLLGIFITQSIITILYTDEARKTRLFYLSNNNCHESSHVCSNTGNMIQAILFSVFLIIVCTLIIVLLPTCAAVASDGCVYLAEQRGVAQADYVLNSYISNEIWPKITEEIEKSLNGSAEGFLVLSSPRNLINVSTVICRQSTREAEQMGLLGALGWNTFISVKNILNSPEVQQKMEEGEKSLKAEILKLDLSKLIPNDVDQIINTSQNLTQYFDSIDYQPSIDELSPSALATSELATYVDSLENLILKIERLGLSSSSILKQCVNLIRNGLVALTQVGAEALLLRNAFVVVQTNRNLTSGIDGLVKSIKDTKEIFSNQEAILAPVTPVYSRLMESFKAGLETNLNPIIGSFVHNLFPCSQIYMATDALLTMICRQSGALSRFFSWFYVLAIAIVVSNLLFFCTFQLGFIQSNHFRRLKFAPKIASTSINIPSDRYAPCPPTAIHTIPPTPYAVHRQTHAPSALTQQQLQNYRSVAPIPAVYAYADRRDFSQLEDVQSVEASEAFDSVSDIAESSLHEVSSYQPIPAPRSGKRYPVPESESSDEMSNHDEVQSSTLQQPSEHDI